MVVKPTAFSEGIKASEFEHIPASLPPPNSSASFWHTQPSEFLLGHRTTPNLPSEADVVIIGSGITGASAARFLLEGVDGEEHGRRFVGKKVVMLEAREACWGATGRNGGHLQPIVLDRPANIARFELRNCREVAEYIAANDIPCEYRAVAGCRTFWTEKLFAEACAQVEERKTTDPDVGAVITTVDGDDREGMQRHLIGRGCKGATLTEGAASLWPYKYVAWMLERLVREKGLNLQTTTPVTKMSCETLDGSLRHDEAMAVGVPDKVWTLHTARGEITTRNVLLATNGWTTHLLPHLCDLLMPVRGTMSSLLPPPSLTHLIPNSYGFYANGLSHDPSSDEYLTQRPYAGVPNAKGHLMYGGGREAGDLPTRNISDDLPIDRGSVEFLRESLPRALTLSDDEKPLELDMAWSGIMCFSRDNCPWVGGVPGMEGVWLCGAYTGHGMPNATLCAKACVEMMQMSVPGRTLHGPATGPSMSRTALSASDAGHEIVRQGKLPAQYLFTEQRMAAARQLPTIAQQDMGKFACYL